ncbi:SDR family oxidoreductase [Candidatus Poribacteria bacterium]|nr:SDR family oxidoreductase [Candidatus Poribacteria bacterium]
MGVLKLIDTGLNGKTAIVTGANHGIGAATAKALAAQGCSVFITYMQRPLDEHLKGKPNDLPGEAQYRSRQAMSADWIVEEIRSSGGKAQSWEADLSDTKVIPEIFNRAERAFGPVQVLVNNAAHWKGDTVIPSDHVPKAGESWSHSETITPEIHDNHFAVNSRAVALMMVELTKRHIDKNMDWGRIINISTDGAACFPGEISYGASKYALESYSRSAAWELGKYGITVNIISPGPIQTGYIQTKLKKICEDDTPLGRLGQPEDVTDVVVFLASNQARWVTGQLIYVGGGHRM